MSGLVLAAVLLSALARGTRPPSAAAVMPWLAGLLGRWTPLLLGLGGLLALGWAALGVLRWTVFIPRTLRTRVAHAILPPPDFDPRPEAIEAFGQQLLGVRRRVLAWLDRPASAFRIQLTTTADGRLLYVVELPARFRGSLLNAYATAYPAVDVRPLAEIAGSCTALSSAVGGPAGGGAGELRVVPQAGDESSRGLRLNWPFSLSGAAAEEIDDA